MTSKQVRSVLPREDHDRQLFADAVISELHQFENLRNLDPPISSDEIAHRIVWPVKEVRWLLKKFKDLRP